MSASQFGDSYDGATAVGEPVSSKLGNGSNKALEPIPPIAAPANFVDSSNFLDVKRPLCVPIGKDGVKGALEKLNRELIESGLSSIISDKRAHSIVGREVNPGSFGLYEYGSSPKIILNPGKYPGLPLANWIGCDWKGTYDLASNFPPLDATQDKHLMAPNKELARLGLTIVQVGQNQAAVCLDPQNRVFVIADGGFVAMATNGAYKVVGLVDMTHLSTPVTDPYTKNILGYTQTVKHGAYTCATFLDIPANNVVILQRGNELYQLGAGQHFLTTAAVTVRGWYTTSEVQVELECEAFSKDQVAVWLRMYLRYELQHPLQLARHGYRTPFDSLQDKTRSILTQILAHLDYSIMVRSRNSANDIEHPTEDRDEPNSVFVSAVRTQATDELKVVAAEYGIKIEDLAIIDRKFKGEIANRMDLLTIRALEAQVESANLDRENANRRRKQEGDARVLELQNEMSRATAQTKADNAIAEAKAKAQGITIEAEARASAIRLTALAEAEATRLKAEVDATIQDKFAQSLAAGRLEVERTKAYGNNTIFAPLESYANGGLVGMALMQGSAKK